MNKILLRKIIICVACLLCIVLLVGVCSDWFNRFKKPKANIEEPEIITLTDVAVCGASEAPYGVGDMLFRGNDKENYRYCVFGADGELPKIEKGFNASGWNKIKNGQKIPNTDCRNVCIVSVTENNIASGVAYYEYVPGVIYGESNPDQYDDPVFYNEENPRLEDTRAVKLAANLFKSSRSSYYGLDFGYIVQGFLTKYSSYGGILDGYYHTGTDFNTRTGRPFYSPIDGIVIYAGEDDDYNTVMIYNEEHNVTLLILHGEDVSPTKAILENGGDVKAGDLLGYGGGAGQPAGDTHIHIELRNGEATRYQNFSLSPEYTRLGNYDPLVISDMFALSVPEHTEYADFEKLGTTPFNAYNGSSVIQVGNWIYFIDKMNGGNIIKSRPDGSELTIVNECSAANLNYKDGWLYYSNLSDAGHLVKTSLESGETVKLAEIDAHSYILVVNDWIYFADANNKNNMYRIRTDGTTLESTIKRDVKNIFYNDGSFYYTQDTTVKADRIYKWDEESMAATQLLPSRADSPFLYEGKLCFREYYADKNGLAVENGVYDEATAEKVINAAYNLIQPGNRYLIFTNENDGNSMYLEFDDDETIFKLTGDILCTDLNYNGGWIYYYTALDEGNILCRINVEALTKYVLDIDGTWKKAELDYDEELKERLYANRINKSLDEITELEVEEEVTPEPTAEATPTAQPTATPTPQTIPIIKGKVIDGGGEDDGKKTEAPEEKTTETPGATATPEVTEKPENTSEPTKKPEEEPKEETE